MFKYFAVEKYYNYLFWYLKNRYGIIDAYTEGQIKRTVEDCKFSKKFLPYAYALYLDKEKLIEVLSKEYPKLSAFELRQYIANKYFNKNENYEFKEHVLSVVGNSKHGYEESGISDAGND